VGVGVGVTVDAHARMLAHADASSFVIVTLVERRGLL
jgi:hypothetical protein